MNRAIVFLKGFKKGFRNFSHLITDIVNFILLFFVYFIGIGIVSIIGKLFGKHFMDLKFSSSSWVENKLKTKPLEGYYRLF